MVVRNYYGAICNSLPPRNMLQYLRNTQTGMGIAVKMVMTESSLVNPSVHFVVQILVVESAKLGGIPGSRGHGGKEGFNAFRALLSLWNGEIWR